MSTNLDNNEKKKLFSIFENIKSDLHENVGLNKTQNSDVLIVDGMNLYIRAFSANPQLNDDGLHTGGIAGFLKSIGHSIKVMNPTRCIIVFDGTGGSVRRKAMFPNYKDRRANKIRLNRIFEEGSTSELESQALARQLLRISHYIDTLPVTTIQVDNVEADDVIAYLSNQSLKNSNITILSSDKDFYQLVSDRVKIYNPAKKKLYGVQDVINEYNIHPNNFVLYRILDGDVSDNIDGIKGFGIKTVVKCFPFLSESKKYLVEDLIKYAESNKGKYKAYQNLLDNPNIAERNYQLMQLSETIIATFAQLNIEDILKKKNKLNRFQFNNMITEDKMWNAIPNHGVWLESVFKKLDNFVL
jgi:5'-3' exonuclease